MPMYLFLINRLSRQSSELTRELGLLSDTVEVVYKDAAKRLLQKVFHAKHARGALREIIVKSILYSFFAEQLRP